MIRVIVAIVFLFSMACGVKGDPVPPEQPAHIGRGKPNFKKAVERFDIRTEAIDEEQDQSEDDEDDE